MAMKVSIITVCFNSVLTIRDTIESVLSQDYADIEYIIIDGVSSDGTMGIIQEYKDNISTVISEQDYGIYDAMNKGIAAATGEVIGMLNADDFYVDDTVVRQLIECMESESSDTVYADLTIVDPVDTRRTLRHYSSSTFNRARLRYGWMPAHPTFLVKRELYEAYVVFLWIIVLPRILR